MKNDPFLIGLYRIFILPIEDRKFTQMDFQTAAAIEPRKR